MRLNQPRPSAKHARVFKMTVVSRTIDARTQLWRVAAYQWRRNCVQAVTEKDNEPIEVLGKAYVRDEMTNVTTAILKRVGRNLHRVPQHPVNIIKQRVVNHFHKYFVNSVGNPIFAHFDDVGPVVTTEQNFDSLLVPPNHVCRSKKDNYYINNSHMLRAHTSSHQCDFVKMGFDRFLVTGDVYRRDTIDSTHYPVFHQTEGVRLYTNHELFRSAKDDTLAILEHSGVETEEKQAEHTIDAVRVMEIDLKQTLEDLVRQLFGKDIQTRWVSAYFPFTHPSYELEIYFRGEWMEMLGSGIMRQKILVNGGAENKVGWAFGLGLDRLAMLLFNIPSIRLLWSTDPRFLDQFKSVGIDPCTDVTFQPFSNYPPCYKDVSFWLDSALSFASSDLYEIVRSVAGDLVEKVELLDEFVHPETKRVSNCYRLAYRSMDRTFTDEEINVLQNKVRDELQKTGLELR